MKLNLRTQDPKERDTLLILGVGLLVVLAVTLYCIAKGMKLMPY